MSTAILIEQAGLVADGVPGRARTDGKGDGSLVTLTNGGDGATTLFRLLWTPPGDTTATSSLAETPEDPKVWTFSPTAGVFGSYLIELVQNAGLLTEKRERRVFAVRSPYRRLVVPALNERGDVNASLVTPGTAETVDNNAFDELDPALADLPFAGWWRALHSLIKAVDDTAAPVRVVHYHSNVDGAVDRYYFPNMAAAFAQGYPSSFPSTAVYEIEPTTRDVDPGPYTLDTVVRYVIRSVAGNGAAVLPELTLGDNYVTIEQCRIGYGLHGGLGAGLILRRCDVVAAIDGLVAIEAFDSAFFAPVEIEGIAGTFDRCTIFSNVTSSFSSGGTPGTLTLVNCTFAPGTNIEFTGPVAGVVHMDARSKYLWDNTAGTNLVNGSILVEAPP